MIVEVDGERVEVPDDASVEEIDAISRQGARATQPAPEPKGPGPVDRFLEGGGKYTGILPYLASRPGVREFVTGMLPPTAGPVGAAANVATGGRYGEVAPVHGGLYQPPLPPVERQEGETPSHAVIRSSFDPAITEQTLPAAMMASVPGGGRITPKPGGVADDIAAWLRAKAGTRNIKAAGGIQSDIVRARKQLGPGGANNGRAALQEIGAEMGEKGLVGPLSTSAKTFDRAAALMDDAGGRMGSILDAADQAGGVRPTVQDVVRSGDEILSALQRNPHTASAGDPAHVAAGHSMGSTASDQFGGLIAKYRRIYGDRPLTFQEAHQIRRNIDKDLYGLRGSKDPWADSYKEALHDFRDAVSQQIDASLDAATRSSQEWKTANRDYQVASKALEFADKGLDRAQGNNLVSLTELMAGLTGASVDPVVGAMAAGGTALARRHGSGILGSAALNASNAIRGGVPRLPPQVSGQALAEFLRSRGLSVRPPVGVAEDDEERPR